ncbi:uncharacterized protein LOC110422010 [Herrania umbratica]|uniref:Uncharacterized protein LOC110422010 n=1 Tax=Herrania umbratica TaxID=108875 RepID=A0A6J1AWP6_9ROSI|nr:uncharacterized protein LOC110422010 [Herrania umbratica]
MPPLNLTKKLKPARKAWRSFTNKVRSKLHNFHVPSSIKAASHRLLEFCSLRLFAPLRKRFLSKYSSSRPRRYEYNHLYHYQHYQNQLHKNRKVIYIDQLYAEPMSMQAKHVEPQAESSRRNEVAGDKALRSKGKEEESSIYSIDDSWNAIVARSPHLRGVDERADEFIYKFHEDRKLEKERSDLDFQEMLARSA